MRGELWWKDTDRGKLKPLGRKNCPTAVMTRESRVEKSSDSDINAYQQSALSYGLFCHRSQVVTVLDTVQNIFKQLFTQ